MRADRNLKDPMIEPTISTSYEIGTEFRLFNSRFGAILTFITEIQKSDYKYQYDTCEWIYNKKSKCRFNSKQRY